MLTERLKCNSKELTSRVAVNLARKARRAVILEQAAEALRVRSGCEHVSIYGCQNKGYPRSGEAMACLATWTPRVSSSLTRTIMALEA